jgi:hypothetical protein
MSLNFLFRFGLIFEKNEMGWARTTHGKEEKRNAYKMERDTKESEHLEDLVLFRKKTSKEEHNMEEHNTSTTTHTRIRGTAYASATHKNSDFLIRYIFNT